jgi:hypothetical protein
LGLWINPLYDFIDDSNKDSGDYEQKKYLMSAIVLIAILCAGCTGKSADD